jgi:antitoxin YefM
MGVEGGNQNPDFQNHLTFLDVSRRINRLIMRVTTMQTVNQATFAQNLSTLLDRLRDDHSPLIITRDAAEPAVLMSWSDFRSIEETAYLMASPRNAQRLNQSIDALHAGKGLVRPLPDDQ